MALSWRTGLLAITNILLVANLLAHLAQLQHLCSSGEDVPEEARDYIKPAEYTALHTSSIEEVRVRIVKLCLNALVVNVVLVINGPACLWQLAGWGCSSVGLQSGVFNACWSLLVVLAYEYVDVMLFSTWLLHMNDSGLDDLAWPPERDHVWQALMLTVLTIIWFASGFLVAVLKPQHRNLVLPAVTALLVGLGLYELMREPGAVAAASYPLDVSVRGAVEAVTARCQFDPGAVRFREGHVGSGQTVWERNRIIVLSGPSQGALEPEEWAALVANELGHVHYRHALTRLVLRFSVRLLWTPLAIWMLADPQFYASFGLESDVEPLVFGFAVTEIFAAQFDKLMFWIKALAFRAMEDRADRFALDLGLVDEETYRRTMIKVALANRQPLSGARLYGFQFCPSRSPMSRELRRRHPIGAEPRGVSRLAMLTRRSVEAGTDGMV